jgi:hypothetical protein
MLIPKGVILGKLEAKAAVITGGSYTEEKINANIS